MLILGLTVIVIVALIMSFVAIRRGSRAPTAPTSFAPPKPPPGVRLTRDLQQRVRDTASRGDPGQAAKQLTKQAGVPTTQATAIVYALQAGQVFPEPEPESTGSVIPRQRRAPVDDELLGTLRSLVAQDRLRRTAAISLLRERTGMNSRDARRFLDAL